MDYTSIFICFSFLFISWFFYVEDRFLMKLHHLKISNDTILLKSGDIIRVGPLVQGAIASHWLERPLHHYVLVISVEGVLCVVHTWYTKTNKPGILNIPPSYQLQPLDMFIKYGKFELMEVFRYDNIPYKNMQLDTLVDIIRSFNNSVRCYTTIMNLFDKIYPELQINFGFVGESNIRNNCLMSFFLYKPLYFENTITRYGFKKEKIMLIKNIINESNVNLYNSLLRRIAAFGVNNN